MLSSKIAINREEFVLLREYIQQECGIVVGDEKVYLIESRLARLVVETGSSSFKEFYLKAKSDITKKLRDKIVDAMTTNETLWFRDMKPWTIIKEILIPKFFDDLKSGRKQKITVWSAACSTGQEPYSLAMLLDEAMRKDPRINKNQFSILGTDISPSALYMAISGRYNTIAMSRGMLPGYKERYFIDQDGVSEIKPEIKEMVVYKQFNLQHDFAKIPSCDLIFCRNVAIYFSPEFKKELFKKIHAKLYSDGYFFIGSTESLIGYSTDYEQLEYQKGVYYKPKK
ncbi:MAG: protein-glutamate O-methyltransferase CheR [Candidatus Cloacimonadales bacterium]|jgi:chemotaxis protein methyltransferase CheR|nr:protein-glutamate O-methyltransferase CheR [Candidatus Cloacimonadota bacterium]MDD2650484.1 protein-glutamate O-methyltransferase CheR [Candidatus Cloacimonadota bacterium]MDX9977609.1 protein-glutamate O-methyltransferase CheR [Candidatus Cloacimonadales bacterium]